MRRVRQTTRAIVWLLVLLAIGFALYALVRNRPQDMPWRPLDLSEPMGMFTGRKLAGLADEFPKCRQLLDRAGVRYAALPPVVSGQCGYTDGVRLNGGGARTITFAPRDVGMACPVAAAMVMWEWQVVQPAARRHFDTAVVRIEHLGSYNCRRMYGRSTGDWSEHAAANALDVAGFVLADGTRVTVVGDWKNAGPRAAFLREVRDGACDLFSTVLSPDYNAAHRDHFHLDQARRGAFGGRACR